jgi:outer membrane receptor protein involved in Fe transport
VLALLLPPVIMAENDDAVELAPVVTTTTRAARLLEDEPASVSRVEQIDIERVGHTHVNEIFHRIPGAVVTRNSGQEHLTAIRSPVLTGPGACGAFLFLEDGISSRAAGFCNVNGLFEINTEQAAAIEVVRGPGGAVHGSNALHGMVNVISRSPADAPRLGGFVETGSDAYHRAGFSAADTAGERWRISANYTDDGGWRQDSGLRQGKLNARAHRPLAGGELQWLFAATDLDQDTAGFLVGRDAYRTRPRDNDNPEAFRRAEAQRLAARWLGETAAGTGIEITPYLRRADMAFPQHFLPGQPVETNDQLSLGLMTALDFELFTDARLRAGADFEYTRATLTQFQEGEAEGTPFIRETRPPGGHYDYQVDAVLAAAWLQHERPLSDHLRLDGGLRVEYIAYDYRTRLEPGNLRDDGTECGFGGCLYTRPDDRMDSFTTPIGHIGMTWRHAPGFMPFGRVARGYRAPQATELYRLQSGQEIADLAPEKLDSFELGLRGLSGPLRYEIAAYYMKKRNFIYRDSDGFNVSDGRTRHRGIEADLSWRLAESWLLGVTATHGRHTWAFERTDGAPIERGQEIDSAPRHFGSARLGWRPAASAELELEWIYQGAYWLDTANEHRYHGHSLFALRGARDFGEHWRLWARIHNLTDRPYAERADFAFGNYRYFPGRGRSLFVSLEYRY